MKKVLLVHGWLHSADRYRKLKNDLEKKCDCEVTLYQLPGFGGVPAKKKICVLPYYTKLLKKELEKQYDCMIGHSMGGNVLLKAMSPAVSSKLILLSPAYGGIPLLKPMTVLFPILPLGLFIIKMYPCLLTDFLIRCMAGVTINSRDKIDTQIFKDVRRADVFVSVSTLFELVWDTWKIDKRQWKNREVVLVIGEKDRVIRAGRIRRFCGEPGGCTVYCIKGIGHTAVLEAYDDLLETLEKEIQTLA